MQETLFSLILPTYNPGPDLPVTWGKLQQFLATQTRRWEVLFVCDGCSDGTEAKLRELIATCPYEIRLLCSPKNRGKGHAVRRGLLRARGDYRIFTDVDLAYPLEMVTKLADELVQGHDVVIASRAHADSAVQHASGMQKYLRQRQRQSALFNLLARTILGIRQRDTQAGLKGFTDRAVRTMLPYVKCQGFGFDCELLVACRYFGIPVRELPAQVIYDSTVSTTRLTSGAAILGELLTIRHRWRRFARVGLDRSILITAADLEAARVYDQRRRERMQRRIQQVQP